MNKIFKGIIGALLAGSLLSGCAGLNDSYKDHALGYVAFVEEDSWRMSEQTDAIMAANVSDKASENEVMLFNVIKVLAVGQIKPSKFTLSAPTTAYDVAIEGIKIIPGLGTTIGFVRMVDKVAENIGDENYSSEGGDIKVNKTEVHTTAIGDSNAMNSNYTNNPEPVVEEEVEEIVE